jgi:N6-L-threonylcarbamoyladenine synthase
LDFGVKLVTASDTAHKIAIDKKIFKIFPNAMLIGIESSCDESAIAVFDGSVGVVFEEVSSQAALHGAYGGVVPELASREHARNFIPLLERLKTFGVGGAEAVAVTAKPGLPGCLCIGVALARALALILRIPTVEIDHLHGHLFSPFIPLHRTNPNGFLANLRSKLPHLGLLVSGGNTAIFRLDLRQRDGRENFGRGSLISPTLTIEIIAETQDDAAGEAFDKGAKLLGLPYPGGASVEKLAEGGNPRRYLFPRAFPDRSAMKFSFSGLKTSLRYFLERFDGDRESSLGDICASYQAAIIDALSMKMEQAMGSAGPIGSIGVSGGVSNNDVLRNTVANLAKKFSTECFFPLRRHTGDNAAMVAFAAHVQGGFDR